MRKLATIQRIDKLESISGADNIEVASVKGWKVVVQKGKFTEGDLCVYFEIDSVLPERPEFEFLREKKFRVKTVRLRGQISQGLCFPLDILGLSKEDIINVSLGDDATEYLGVTEYEPPTPVNMSGKKKGKFPEFIPKTDIERIQNIPDKILLYRGRKVVITEKIDGASFTAYIKNGEIGYCSKNLELEIGESNKGNVYYEIFQKITPELFYVSNLLGNIAIQGEIIGEGIQSNRYKIKGRRLYLYNIYIIDIKRHISYRNLKEVIKGTVLEAVPFIGTYRITGHTNIEYFISRAGGKSKLNSNIDREGLVCRIERGGELEYLFKVINNNYLLKENE